MAYTSERNNQIVIELLKYHGIKKIVVSPGATNVSLVASIQNDDFFELYSCVDERSAAYIACGLAEQSEEAVALSCTGATASRNYFPGLTEAYYRKLPILAITSTLPLNRIGHNIPQVLDRTVVSNDICKGSYHVPMVNTKDDEWNCVIKVNEALLELKHNGLGPVHLNLETAQSGTFDVEHINYVQPIDRILLRDKFPQITHKKIAIFLGAHSKWSDKLTTVIDRFCEEYNAVILGDHTSNYKGKYLVPSSLITNQRNKNVEFTNYDLVIHLGNISGAYLLISPKEVWRVNLDGALCDTFRKLRYVFEMDEIEFFSYYLHENSKKNISNYEMLKNEYLSMKHKIPELPFSNVWVAQKLAEAIPEESILHLGILNSLRSWNYFELPKTVLAYSNTGGFGIDGCISTAMGATLSTDKLVYCVLGDLAFFYDMNSIGNRDLQPNLRILIINNGHGQEFRTYGHRASQFGNQTDKFIAAAGHYGNKSLNLVKHYAEDLGFEYITANSKESFEKCYRRFCTTDASKAPMIFEVFTNNDEETEATRLILGLNDDANAKVKDFAKQLVRGQGVKAIKNILRG